MIGIFGELGYDYYTLASYSYTYGYGYYSWTDTWSYYYYTYFHLGVTFRLGGTGGGSSASSSSSRSSSSSSSGRYMIVNADTLNVRSGPSADNPAVGQVSRGTRVQVVNSSGTWWRIRAGNIEGYVNSSYLVEEN